MAKALFHKMQRVYVKPVGTWALVERVIPHWVKDVDEPLRVTYECGLGRPFQAHELVSEQVMQNSEIGFDDDDADEDLMMEHWRVARRSTRWRASMSEHAADNLGTFPVVLTNEGEAGGWRVSPADFDRDPERVEHQARMIVHTPDLLRVARRIAEFSMAHPDEVPEKLRPVTRSCAAILRYVYELNEAPESVAAE
ncbi:MAG: hypothetical protein R3C08_00695 [Hyphomonas sp.]|nr:hypothetical protein [Hyphomonas sp.]HRX72755.1 hypothetical protein [Hyphomonas sp.]